VDWSTNVPAPPPCSQTVQHLVYERPEADKRAAVRRLCRAARPQPKPAQCRVGVDGRRLRVAVRARPHARG
jgi:hypothetical protein